MTRITINWGRLSPVSLGDIVRVQSALPRKISEVRQRAGALQMYISNTRRIAVALSPPRPTGLGVTLVGNDLAALEWRSPADPKSGDVYLVAIGSPAPAWPADALLLAIVPATAPLRPSSSSRVAASAPYPTRLAWSPHALLIPASCNVRLLRSSNLPRRSSRLAISEISPQHVRRRLPRVSRGQRSMMELGARRATFSVVEAQRFRAWGTLPARPGLPAARQEQQGSSQSWGRHPKLRAIMKGLGARAPAAQRSTYRGRRTDTSRTVVSDSPSVRGREQPHRC